METNKIWRFSALGCGSIGILTLVFGCLSAEDAKPMAEPAAPPQASERVVKQVVQTAAAATCPEFDVNNLNGSFCSTACRCGVGEGDCDSNSQCNAGLVCKRYSSTQRPHGFPLDFDICVDPDCPPFNGVEPATRPSNCKLSVGEADCNTDDHCGGDLECVQNVGKALHKNAAAWLDVCLHPRAADCSGCSPSCPCDLGQGYCSSDGDCRPGLVCGEFMGLYLGQGEVSVCTKPEAVQPARCTSDAECPEGHCTVHIFDGSSGFSVLVGGSTPSSGICTTGAAGELCTAASDCQQPLQCCGMEAGNCTAGGYCACAATCD